MALIDLRIQSNRPSQHKDDLVDDVGVPVEAGTRQEEANRYQRDPDRQPYWREVTCAENNNHVEIGKQNYMLSPDGRLTPTRKDQPPPDLRYFNRSRKQGP